MANFLQRLFGISDPELTEKVNDHNHDDGGDDKHLIGVLRFLTRMAIFGGVIIFIYAIAFIGPDQATAFNLTNFLKGFGIMLLIAGGAYMGGLLTGGLFAIPKIKDNSANNENIIDQNDNLVEISDWITKIIVGVGLTQLHEIPTRLKSMGAYFSAAFGSGTTDKNGESAAIAAIIYYVILGFITSYLWTRINFAEIMNNAIKKLTYKLKQTKVALRETKDELEKKGEELTKKDEELTTVQTEKEEIKQQFDTKRDEMDALSNSFHIEKIVGAPLDTERNGGGEDKNKGQFGGLAENNGKKITAEVNTTTYSDDLFNIVLKVISTNPDVPLIGSVQFYIHETFKDPVRVVDVVDGVAELKLVAWGAFTVGVACDKDEHGVYQTKLELDLAELPGAPQKFKER